MMNRWEEIRSTAAPGPAASEPGRLCLYVAGPGARAKLAEANVRRCCDTHFAGRYRLEVIDVRQQPELARHEQLVALPALVRHQPTPRQHLVGTLSDEAQLLGRLALGTDY